MCYRVGFLPGQFPGWGCSNFSGPGGEGSRTVLVNGVAKECGNMDDWPEPLDDAYYFEVGPGDNTSAAVYWWGFM